MYNHNEKRYTVITGFPIGSEMKMIGFGNSHPFFWHCFKLSQS